MKANSNVSVSQGIMTMDEDNNVFKTDDNFLLLYKSQSIYCQSRKH